MKIYKPKEEFQQAINIQNAYVELLKNYHKELNDKIKSSKGFALAKYQLEFYEIATKLDEQIGLLREKINHFDNNFINQYDIELKECEEKFDEIIKNPKELLRENFDKWYDYLEENHEKTYKNARELLRKKGRDDLENEFITQDDVDEEKKKLKTIISFKKRSGTIYDEKLEKIDFYVKDWQKLDLKDRNHIEVKNVLYKDLRNLVTFPQI